MKKYDWILAAGILLLVVFSGAFLYGRRSAGRDVSVQVDGTEYGRYSLSEDQTIEIGGSNRLEIKDGKVSMVSADCPDQICVKTAAIKDAHEVIVCMPNRVVAEVVE